MREMSTSYTKSIKPEQIKTILTKEQKMETNWLTSFGLIYLWS